MIQPAIVEDRAADGALSDHQLVQRVRRGSEAAVRTLVRRHNQRLFRVARGVLRDDSDAEDAVQDAYTKAFMKIDSFRGDAAFVTWLTRIVLNEAYARLRRRRHLTDLSELERSETSAAGQVILFPTSLTPANPESEADREQVRHILERALDELPEPFRLVFMLRDVEGLDTEDTANVLSIRAETVKTRLHRARKLLRSALERKIASGFSGLFPFDGERCVHMADRVVERLRQQGMAR